MTDITPDQTRKNTTSKPVEFTTVVHDARVLYEVAARRSDGSEDLMIKSWNGATMSERAPYVAAVMNLYSRIDTMDDYIQWGHLPIVEAMDTCHMTGKTPSSDASRGSLLVCALLCLSLSLSAVALALALP